MRRKSQAFPEAVDAAQHLQGWTHAQIAEALAVQLSTMQSWLKPPEERRRSAPGWASMALHALAYGRPLTVRWSNYLEVTYTPIHRRKFQQHGYRVPNKEEGA